MPSESASPDLRAALAALHPACWGWALACCSRDRDDAQDVLQRAYLRILEGRARYNGTATFRTFVFGVIRNVAREQISAELQKAQATFTSVQWRIAAEAEKLEKLLDAPTVDEARVLAQVDAILGLEREVKRTHIALLVRIRNVLTPQQRERLMQLKGR